MKEEIPVISRGSFIAELWNRSILRAYSQKIVSRTIQPEEVSNYIVKGGNINAFTAYSFMNIAKPLPDPLVNFFIYADSAKSLPPDRIKSMELLLSVGADPNRWTSDSRRSLSWIGLPPIHLAALFNDLEALKVLVRFKANLNFMHERSYLGYTGPALMLCTDPNVADFLFANGADPHFRDLEGNNLLHLLVNSSAGKMNISGIKWLIGKKVSPHIKNRSGETALMLIQNRISSLGKEATEIQSIFHGFKD